MSVVFKFSGFPPGYSNVKAELFLKNEAKDVGVTFRKVTSTELEFTDERDAEKFTKSLREIKFGGKTYHLNATKTTGPILSRLSEPVVRCTEKNCWFDLEDLPCRHPNQTAILIKHPKTEISPDDICKYFQSKADSNGGAIERIVLMFDGILVIFHHSGVAERVLEARIHRISGQTVRLFRKDIPEFHQDRLIRKNEPNDSLPVDDIKEELANLSPASTRPEVIVESENKGVFMACYKHSLGDFEFQTVLKQATERNLDSDSKVRPLPKTDCVSVEGLPTSFDLRRLQILLENKAFSGGAVVTNIDRAKSGEALVYFESFKQADEIMKRYAEIPISKFECTLRFKRYFHCLSHVHTTAAVTSFEKQVDERILNFVTTRKKHFDRLKTSFKPLAYLEIVNNAEKCAIIASPVSVEIADDDYKDSCNRTFEEFFADFVTQKREDFGGDNLAKAREERRHQYFDEDGIDDKERDFVVEWKGFRKNVLVVTGVKSHVESVVEDLSNLVNFSKQSLSLSEGKYRWLAAFRPLSPIDGCKIERDDETHSLTFTGTQPALSRALSRISSELEAVREEKLKIDDQEQAKYFETATKLKEIEEHVNKALPQRLKAVIAIEQGIPHLWCQEDRVNDCVDHMKTIVVVDKTIHLTDEENETTKTNEWVQERNILQNEYLVSLSIQERNGSTSMQNRTVVVVGFQQGVTAAKQKIKAFFDERVIHKISFPISFGGAQYILSHVKDFTECDELNEIQYGYEYGDNTIYLKGKRTSVDKVLGILKKQDIVEERKTWSFYRILNHFERGQGKAVLDKARSDNHCVILIDGTFPKPSTENPKPAPRTILRPQFRSSPVRNLIRTPKLVFSVAEGDITSYQSDAIVNCVGDDFSLKTAGQLSEALMKNGGPSIQSELETIKQGQVRVTSSGNLQTCKHIMHVNFTAGSFTIKSRLKEVLEKAEDMKCKSLAIPAIGTGKMSKSPSEIAKLMHEEFCNYRASTTTKFLEKVVVVVFNSNIVPEFKKVFVDQGPRDQVNSVTLGPLQLTVRKGDITEENCDAIVNGIGSDFDLTKAGQVATQIMKKGGDDIQKQLSKEGGTEMRLTSGGKLPCKKIVHAVLPSAPDKLKKTIKDILSKGDVEKCRSISFPAIGTGSMKIKTEVAAKCMREAFAEFARTNSITRYLSEVNVVVFQDSLYSGFLKELITEQISAAGATPQLNQGGVKAETYTKMSNFGVDEDGFSQISENIKVIGPIQVIVVKGDITEQNTDAIVNCTGQNFDISHGLVSRRIVEKGGNEITKQLASARGNNLRVTDAGNLRCKKIIHVPSPSTSEQLQAAVGRILLKAEDEKCASVAMPAIATGRKNLASDVVAGNIREALTKFAQDRRSTSHLKKVFVVIFDEGQYLTFLKQLFGFHSRCKQPNAGPAQDPKYPHKITLYFYCEKAQRRKLSDATAAISDRVDSDFCHTDILIDDLLEVLSCKSKELLGILSTSGVGYVIDEDTKKISLSGIKDLVNKTQFEIGTLTASVTSVMQLHSMTSHSWKYEFNDLWVNFDGFWNVILEKARTSEKQFQVIELTISGNQLSFTANLDKMSMRSKDGRFDIPLRREVKEDLPPQWEAMGEKENFKWVTLDSSSTEFQHVKKKLFETVKNANIQSISRIQNKMLFLRYQQEKARVEKICRYRPFEMELFHGTSAANCDKIANEGFNRAFAGDANAKALGLGVYFARFASYSNNEKYSTPDDRNIKRMFLANVVTGEYCQGKFGMKVTPTKPRSNEQFNSAVDRTKNPTIFVVFTDVGAYPSYLIKYSLS